MRIFNNAKHHNAIVRNLETSFAFLTMLGLEAEASICSRIKKKLILNCCKFSAIVVAVRI